MKLQNLVKVLAVSAMVGCGNVETQEEVTETTTTVVNEDPCPPEIMSAIAEFKKQADANFLKMEKITENPIGCTEGFISGQKTSTINNGEYAFFCYGLETNPLPELYGQCYLDVLEIVPGKSGNVTATALVGIDVSEAKGISTLNAYATPITPEGEIPLRKKIEIQDSKLCKAQGVSSDKKECVDHCIQTAVAIFNTIEDLQNASVQITEQSKQTQSGCLY